jgi:hypothetical protein
MDPDALWNDLAAAALLGTERRAFEPPSASGDLGTLLAGLRGSGPERALLGTAAALALYRRAGRKGPADAQPPPAPAADDERPRGSPAASAHLGMMLAGSHSSALPEWLEALDRAGRRVPEEWLPALLDRGRSDETLRLALTAVLDRRGRWLAAQNPDWSYAAETGDAAPGASVAEDAWQTGTAPQRTALLRRLRAHDTARGLALVASTWAVDPFADRVGFLSALEVGLSMADEPFLEDALDDRRKEVRTVAADLLARLPGSRLCRRMLERAAPLLRLTDRPPLVIDEAAALALIAGADDWDGAEAQALREMKAGTLKLPKRPDRGKDGPTLDVDLPEACDKGMLRDGVEPKSSRSGVGERAWWLAQMVGMVPPSAWCRAWGRSPGELVEAVLRGKWHDALFPALADATRRHRDPDWAEALLPHRRLAGESIDVAALLAILPPERRQATALRSIQADDAAPRIRFKADPLTDDQMTLLANIPPPWGDDLAREVLARLPHTLNGTKYFDAALLRFLPAAGLGLPPALALEAASDWTIDNKDLPPSDRRQVDEFLALLQFRHDMLKELSA